MTYVANGAPGFTFDVIIPARDEAATVAAVVRAARCSRASRVIVIDDHSTDATARIAAEAGAEVVTSRGRGNKAAALATGVAASSAPVLVFFDADILDARPEHFELLAAPLAEGFAMCCGLIDYGRAAAFYMRLPPITGLRAVRREVFDAVSAETRRGFQIEILINEVVARGRMPSAIRVLAGARHRSKLRKMGVARGLAAHAAMTAQLLHCLTFIPWWTYIAYLRNLTVLGEGT
ncbi:MAG TPA: glycosyltransferase [Thermoanaerobaculia bacterium]|nr:glycosyltransferase [Thermoanaerobaculia bacterium]